MCQYCREYERSGVIMAVFQSIYKCRLCGLELVAQRTGKDFAMCETAMLACGFYDKCKSPNHTIHFCDDGSVGLTDFQGFRRVE